MNAPTFGIPESLAGDPSDVVDALEVAGALWGKGEAEEAIRWLRRAVAAAGEADDAVRVATLAGIAADLDELVRRRHDTTAPTASDTASGAASDKPVNAETPAQANAVAERETDAGSDRATLPSETAAVAPITERSDAQAAGDVASAPAEHAPPVAHFASASAASNEATESAAMTADAGARPPAIPEPRASVSEPPGTRTAPAPAHPSIAPAATGSGLLGPPRASSAAPPRSTFTKPPDVVHVGPAIAPSLPARLRVSVKASVRDTTLLMVRALADGEHAPPGATEAFLVRVDSEPTSGANGSGE